MYKCVLGPRISKVKSYRLLIGLERPKTGVPRCPSFAEWCKVRAQQPRAANQALAQNLRPSEAEQMRLDLAQVWLAELLPVTLESVLS